MEAPVVAVAVAAGDGRRLRGVEDVAAGGDVDGDIAHQLVLRCHGADVGCAGGALGGPVARLPATKAKVRGEGGGGGCGGAECRGVGTLAAAVELIVDDHPYSVGEEVLRPVGGSGCRGKLGKGVEGSEKSCHPLEGQGLVGQCAEGRDG